MSHQLICADVIEWGSAYTGPLFHGFVSDTPYHLHSIVDRFGAEDSAPAKGDVYARSSRGFMGQEWDGGDISYRKETWEVFYKLLLPGAFGMAFNSSRGWHRMAMAIEDAGFLIHPSLFLFGWVTGQGFPKATNISKQLAKRRGVIKGMSGNAISNDAMLKMSLEERASILRYEFALTGHRYGAQAVKPSMEPIVVFQKPYDRSPLDNIISTGAGALNIDGGRLASKGVIHDEPRGGLLSHRPDTGKGSGRHENEEGRWPSNFVLIHHPGCTLKGVVRRSSAGGNVVGPVVGTEKSNVIFGHYKENPQWIAYGDGDGTELVEYWSCHDDCQILNFEGDARFFYQAGWSREVEEGLLAADPPKYIPKAGKLEREAGLEDRTPEIVSDGRPKPIDNPYLRGETERLNVHPTVKPILLTQWISNLLLPPDLFAPRRLLVPFAGVGSEMIGAMFAGWDEIVGVEIDQEFVDIGERRLEHWKKLGDPRLTLEISEDQQRLF